MVGDWDQSCQIHRPIAVAVVAVAKRLQSFLVVAAVVVAVAADLRTMDLQSWQSWQKRLAALAVAVASERADATGTIQNRPESHSRAVVAVAAAVVAAELGKSWQSWRKRRAMTVAVPDFQRHPNWTGWVPEVLHQTSQPAVVVVVVAAAVVVWEAFALPWADHIPHVAAAAVVAAAVVAMPHHYYY